MDIHVVSTLTAEDEDRVAQALVTALTELLNGLPITVALRIETTGAKVFQCTNVGTAVGAYDVQSRTLGPRTL